MSIEYRKGSLFSAPTSSILAHACNAQGVWGSGIAVGFKKYFPDSYADYHLYCETGNSLGTAFLTHENVLCLVTSSDFGTLVNHPEIILVNTEKALLDFFNNYGGSPREVHSNKFNSGLFNVPWEKTEAVLKKVLEEHPETKWIVWEQ